METFLILNGFELNADVDDSEQVILQLAASQLERQQLLDWVAAHMTPLHPPITSP
jgi:death-on-curing protein